MKFIFLFDNLVVVENIVGDILKVIKISSFDLEDFLENVSLGLRYDIEVEDVIV